MMKIPITKIDFTDEDYTNVLDVLKSGWIVQGKKVKEFEDIFSELTGAKYSVAVTSCTTALHLALIVSDIKKDDEVIIPSFTWIATANAVEYVGAKPVFCDIDLDTFNIDLSKIEESITKNTKAIIPVHLFGLPVDMNKILELKEKHNLKVIEDSACGFGAYYNNIHTGNFGDIGCFSFHPRKAITTGEGGIITTQNENTANKLRSLRDHGAETSDLQRHNGAQPFLLPDFKMLGYNYRMTDIQAALGIGQLKRSGEALNERRRIAKIYDDFINNISWLRNIKFDDKFVNGYQSYVCIFEPEKIDMKNIDVINKKRNEFMKYLFDNGISTRPGTHAVHTQEYYSKKYNIKKEDFPNSYIADKCSITFPLFVGISEDEINYMFDKILNYKF